MSGWGSSVGRALVQHTAGYLLSQHWIKLDRGGTRTPALRREQEIDSTVHGYRSTQWVQG